MRKTLAFATSALVVLGGSALPAQAAGPEAPGELAIGWKYPTGDVIKVTWTDDNKANIVRVETTDGRVVRTNNWAARGVNEYLIVGSSISADDVLRITVVTVDETGAESAPAVSPWFDTIRPPLPTFTSATPLADGSLKLDWSFAEAPVDTTPGDVLDLPPENERVDLYLQEANGAPASNIKLPARTTTATVPPRPRPYPVALSSRNEWAIRGGNSGSSSVVFGAMTTSLQLPASATYGTGIPFTGVAGVRTCHVPFMNCQDPVNLYLPNPGIQTELQARRDATQPWKTIGRYSNQELKFTGNFRIYGGSQYRLYVPAWSHLKDKELTVAPAISTSPRTVAVQAKFLAAGFNTSTALVSQPVKATVSILPATTGKAALQWYDGARWRTSSYISLVNGKGSTTFKAAGRGTTHSWRVVTPVLTNNGLAIAATTSRTFKLSVR